MGRRGAALPAKLGLGMVTWISLIFLAFWTSLATAAPTDESFLRTLAPGLEYGTLPRDDASPDSDSLLYVIRFDPGHWQLRALARDSDESLTTEEWASQNDLTFVTNAGMYGEDGREHVGYFRIEGETLTSYLHPRYESVLATDPLDPTVNSFAIFDTDLSPMSEILTTYDTVVQNLRLIRDPGENRWSPQSRQWSEMAVAMDDQDRILFLFTPVPISMYEWNEWLLSLPLGVRAAQHLEGGSDAQFYLRVGDLEISQSGQTRLGRHLRLARGTPLPNVLGMVPRDGAGTGTP